MSMTDHDRHMLQETVKKYFATIGLSIEDDFHNQTLMFETGRQMTFEIVDTGLAITLRDPQPAYQSITHLEQMLYQSHFHQNPHPMLMPGWHGQDGLTLTVLLSRLDVTLPMLENVISRMNQCFENLEEG
ncbi:type III secretion system chaperone family protein [Algicola sagamiensis]|uniref:hypothetical protein n=1 Tax=Algicola sagamiensis TaxID=163869 RepID=UPI00037DA045|nr:hypothetical protein [Algicola sagamiensis]